jgi:hypothetical protein
MVPTLGVMRLPTEDLVASEDVSAAPTGLAGSLGDHRIIREPGRSVSERLVTQVESRLQPHEEGEGRRLA